MDSNSDGRIDMDEFVCCCQEVKVMSADCILILFVKVATARPRDGGAFQNVLLHVIVHVFELVIDVKCKV